MSKNLPVKSCLSDDEFKSMVVIPKKASAIKARKAKFFSDAESFLPGDELVIGVEINGHVRARPINLMTDPSREISTIKLAKPRLGDIFVATASYSRYRLMENR